jgi:hypothetical protein
VTQAEEMEAAKEELLRRIALEEVNRRKATEPTSSPAGSLPDIDNPAFDTVESEPARPGPYDVPSRKRSSWEWLNNWP